jgi:hypothetical protein
MMPVFLPLASAEVFCVTPLYQFGPFPFPSFSSTAFPSTSRKNWNLELACVGLLGKYAGCVALREFGDVQTRTRRKAVGGTMSGIHNVNKGERGIAEDMKTASIPTGKMEGGTTMEGHEKKEVVFDLEFDWKFQMKFEGRVGVFVRVFVSCDEKNDEDKKFKRDLKAHWIKMCAEAIGSPNAGPNKEGEATTMDVLDDDGGDCGVWIQVRAVQGWNVLKGFGEMMVN